MYSPVAHTPGPVSVSIASPFTAAETDDGATVSPTFVYSGDCAGETVVAATAATTARK